MEWRTDSWELGTAAAGNKATNSGNQPGTRGDDGLRELEQVTISQLPITEENIQTETPHINMADVSVDTQPISVVNFVNVQPAMSSAAEFFGSAVVFLVIESTLRHCIEVNINFAKYKSAESIVTTKIKNMTGLALKTSLWWLLDCGRPLRTRPKPAG